ncbi:hypothetical protein J6590_037284 [Homalodisca vitripennis]|nr:hypothetical protein J6590_037284 [Homalodisca vitripennis]
MTIKLTFFSNSLLVSKARKEEKENCDIDNANPTRLSEVTGRGHPHTELAPLPIPLLWRQAGPGRELPRHTTAPNAAELQRSATPHEVAEH